MIRSAYIRSRPRDREGFSLQIRITISMNRKSDRYVLRKTKPNAAPRIWSSIIRSDKSARVLPHRLPNCMQGQTSSYESSIYEDAPRPRCSFFLRTRRNINTWHFPETPAPKSSHPTPEKGKSGGTQRTHCHIPARFGRTRRRKDAIRLG